MYSLYLFGHILRDESGTVVGRVQGPTQPPPLPLYLLSIMSPAMIRYGKVRFEDASVDI